MAKLILVEGVAGSGKSTTAKKIEQVLSAKGSKVLCFQEGDLHPCDLAWHACVPLPVYEELFRTYGAHRDTLTRHTSVDGTYAYVAYTKLELGPDHPLFIALKGYEPYQGRVSLDRFKTLHLSRWRTFAERVRGDETTFIFECAYLQNHVTELMLTYQQPPEAIFEHMRALIESVRSLAPFLIYLSPTDVAWVIDHAAEERKSTSPEWKDWFDQVIDYVGDSNYGKTEEVTGRAGVLEFFRRRHKLELDIIDQLPIESYIHEVKVHFRQPPIEDNASFLDAMVNR